MCMYVCMYVLCDGHPVSVQFQSIFLLFLHKLQQYHCNLFKNSKNMKIIFGVSWNLPGTVRLFILFSEILREKCDVVQYSHFMCHINAIMT